MRITPNQSEKSLQSRLFKIARKFGDLIRDLNPNEFKSIWTQIVLKETSNLNESVFRLKIWFEFIGIEVSD